MVRRRQLLVRNGDVVVVRTAAHGFQAPTPPTVYQLRIQGGETMPEQFANFDRAAIAGEEIATRRKVSLFYLESDSEPPYLLRDFR